MKYQKITPGSTIETNANPDAPIMLVLKEAEALREEHSLGYVDVNYNDFTMSVDGETCLAQLSTEYFSWAKKKNKLPIITIACEKCGHAIEFWNEGEMAVGKCSECGHIQGTKKEDAK